MVAKRLRLADGETMAIETLHVPHSLVPGLTAKDLEDLRFVAVLRKQDEHLAEALGSVVIEPWDFHEPGGRPSTRGPLDSVTPASALRSAAYARMNVSLSRDRLDASGKPSTNS